MFLFCFYFIFCLLIYLFIYLFIFAEILLVVLIVHYQTSCLKILAMVLKMKQMLILLTQNHACIPRGRRTKKPYIVGVIRKIESEETCRKSMYRICIHIYAYISIYIYIYIYIYILYIFFSHQILSKQNQNRFKKMKTFL